MCRRLAGITLAAAAAVLGPSPAAAGGEPVAITYRPPVEAPLVDHFRPPSSAYGPGNRGIDYATVPGTQVRAAAAGQVVFAGSVGSGRHVVVLHPDGLRTSSSFLATVVVRRGQLVAAGEVVGTTAGTLHFGVRAGEAYLDPLVLLGAGGAPALVRLVPDGARAMGTEGAERGALRRFLAAATGTVTGVGAAAVGWARDGVAATGSAGAAAAAAGARRTWPAAVGPFGPAAWLRVAGGLAGWWDGRDRCTPAGEAPPHPSGRRRVVLVAGLASTSEQAGVDGVDTAGLGYLPGDVVRFSYRGGTTAEAPYDAGDTQQDIAVSGGRLRALLQRLAAEEPGVPVDVIAHSQGGLVARVALGAAPPAGVENLITLATPHGGADLATALTLTGATPVGSAVQALASVIRPGGIDPTSASVRQLSELSALVGRLGAAPLPPGVRVTSIAGRGDVVVTAPRARLPGATNSIVAVRGWNEHPLVPGAPAATREMALALAGMAPTCEGLADAAADLLAGEAITAVEDVLALALAGASR